MASTRGILQDRAPCVNPAHFTLWQDVSGSDVSTAPVETGGCSWSSLGRYSLSGGKHRKECPPGILLHTRWLPDNIAHCSQTSAWDPLFSNHLVFHWHRAERARGVLCTQMLLSPPFFFPLLSSLFPLLPFCFRHGLVYSRLSAKILELLIFPPPLSKCWGYSHASPHKYM